MQSTVMAECSSRQGCCCPSVQNNGFRPKILHSMLYQCPGSPPVMNSTAATAAAAAAAAASVGPHGSHMTSAQPPPPHYNTGSVMPGSVPRPRSSSLGSTGSSVRDSCSPGRESNSSQESYSRGSPMSVTSSPSPSPPVSLPDSKLLGILKGTITSPYSHILQPQQPQPGTGQQRAMTPTVTTPHHRRGPSPLHHSTVSPFPSPSIPLASQSVTTPDQPLNLKRALHDQDQPMDLSCKSKKIKTELSDTSSEYDGHDRQSEPPSPASGEGLGSSPSTSILQSVLCGLRHSGSSSAHRPWSFASNQPVTADNYRSNNSSPWRRPCSRQDSSNPTSPASVTSDRSSERQSPLIFTHNNNNNSIGTNPLGPNQRVGLAKKNQHPARARVHDWMVKLVHFCRARPEFTALPHGDKVTLLLNAWPRILLLYMAEHNFEFAVSPTSSGEDTPSDDCGDHMGLDPEVPTMKGVESIQRFIKKCQNLSLDSKEYQHICMTTLFHSGYPGLLNSDFVDSVNGCVREDLMQHIRQNKPHEISRYSKILLCLHTLFGVNCKMVDTLFCSNKNNGVDTNVLIKEMLTQ